MKVARKDTVSNDALCKVLAFDKPLVLGDLELGCAVIEGDEKDIAVLTQESLARVLGVNRRILYSESEENSNAMKVPELLQNSWLSPCVSESLSNAMKMPYRFRLPSSGRVAYGYPVFIVPELAMAIIQARIEGKAGYRQQKYVDRAVALVKTGNRAFWEGLVYECAGYRRDEPVLQEFLSLIFQPDPAEWQKTFYDKIYEKIYALFEWGEVPVGGKRNPKLAQLTLDWVYYRISPGLVEKLQESNPLVSGKRVFKHHQLLTHIGYPLLQERLRALELILDLVIERGVSHGWGVDRKELEVKKELDEKYPSFKGGQMRLDVSYPDAYGILPAINLPVNLSERIDNDTE